MIERNSKLVKLYVTIFDIRRKNMKKKKRLILKYNRMKLIFK